MGMTDDAADVSEDVKFLTFISHGGKSRKLHSRKTFANIEQLREGFERIVLVLLLNISNGQLL
jgi:hypothetical protein